MTIPFAKPTGRTMNAEYREFVLGLPCRFAGVHRCEGRVEGHHAGRRPHNRKADDDTMVPLCSRAHRDYEHGSGVFYSLNKDQRREWAERAIAETQAQWEKLHG